MAVPIRNRVLFLFIGHLFECSKFFVSKMSAIFFGHFGSCALVTVLDTIKQFAAYPSLSNALDNIDSSAPPIKFQFLL
jgi:hypothetical protein